MKHHHSEQQLYEGLRNKSNEAFSYLYDHYSPALYNIIRRIVGNDENACDILQQVFVNIFLNIENYNPERGRLFAWMTRISKNAAIDLRRSSSFKNMSRNIEIDDDQNIGYGKPGEPSTKSQIHFMRIHINNQPPKYRVVFHLFYEMGYTSEEISKLLRIPHGTVKTRLRKALLLIRTSAGIKAC